MKYKTCKKIIRYLLSFLGILISPFIMKKDEVIILMYHRINDCWNAELDVTIKNFVWQMNYLKKKHYSVISMDEAYNKILNKNFRGKHIVLTFDDGYEDFLLNAYPILKQNEFPSILFLVPGFIDTNKVFGWDWNIGQSKLLSWDQINNLNNDNNVDFGAHTLTHKNVNSIDISTLNHELNTSKIILEEKLGRKIKHFAYPTGIHTELSENIVKKHYNTGVLIYQGKDITPKLDINYRAKLKRVAIRRSDDKFLFISKIKGWLIIESIVKRLMGAP